MLRAQEEHACHAVVQLANAAKGCAMLVPWAYWKIRLRATSICAGIYTCPACSIAPCMQAESSLGATITQLARLYEQGQTLAVQEMRELPEMAQVRLECWKQKCLLSSADLAAWPSYT